MGVYSGELRGGTVRRSGRKAVSAKTYTIIHQGRLKIGPLFVNDKPMFKSMESYVLMIWSLYFMTHDQKVSMIGTLCVIDRATTCK